MKTKNGILFYTLIIAALAVTGCAKKKAAASASSSDETTETTGTFSDLISNTWKMSCFDGAVVGANGLYLDYQVAITTNIQSQPQLQCIRGLIVLMLNDSKG